MWIRIKDDLINLSTVRFIGISGGGQGTFNLYFLQNDRDQNTVYVNFETREKAQEALDSISEFLKVELRFPTQHSPGESL
jgi:hypothetical protein